MPSGYPKNGITTNQFQKGHKIRVGMKHSEQARRNISDGHKGQIPWSKGKHLSEETRKKISEANKGRPSWNKGKELSESHKQSARIARLGKKDSEETKKLKSSIAKERGFGGWNKGKKASNETKLRQSIALKLAYKEGRKISRMLGKKLSNEQRQRLSEMRRKEKAPNWKGGVTPINMQLRGCYKYKIWRECVYKRDNYTCTFCGDNRGGNLEPDHIIPFSSILDQIRFQFGVENLYEKALESELLWNINNGRTLCKDCHRKTDTWGHLSNNKKVKL